MRRTMKSGLAGIVMGVSALFGCDGGSGSVGNSTDTPTEIIELNSIQNGFEGDRVAIVAATDQQEIAEVKIKTQDESGPESEFSMSSTGTNMYSGTLNLAPGNYSYWYSVTDKLGNVTTSNRGSFVISLNEMHAEQIIEDSMGLWQSEGEIGSYEARPTILSGGTPIEGVDFGFYDKNNRFHAVIYAGESDSAAGVKTARDALNSIYVPVHEISPGTADSVRSQLDDILNNLYTN